MKSVAALISGGVDSSVALHILVEQGYVPDLFYIKIGMNEKDSDFTCTQEEDLEMASFIAKKYNLKLNVIDLQKEYWDGVISYTLDKVSKGLTPNPDVMCNTLIKFGAFNDKVGKYYDCLMTGHYATNVNFMNLNWLGTSVDLVKDQTDFLCQVSPEMIQKTLFPIGSLSKSEVRRIATEQKLITATRKDSQGICFLGKINYNSFIAKYLGTKQGDIVEFETNKILGKHNGFYFHTIGQRKGLNLSGGPWFVCKKNIEENIIYVTRNPKVFDLTTQVIHISEPHWLTAIPFPYHGASYGDMIHSLKLLNDFDISFKIRHSPEFYDGKLCFDNSFFIRTENEVGGVAPGQYAVIYNKERTICYGSGEITLGKF